MSTHIANSVHYMPTLDHIEHVSSSRRFDNTHLFCSRNIPCSNTHEHVLEQGERTDDRDLHFLDPAQPIRDSEEQQHTQFVNSSRKLLASNSIIARGGCLGSWVTTSLPASQSKSEHCEMRKLGVSHRLPCSDLCSEIAA